MLGNMGIYISTQSFSSSFPLSFLYVPIFYSIGNKIIVNYFRFILFKNFFKLHKTFLNFTIISIIMDNE